MVRVIIIGMKYIGRIFLLLAAACFLTVPAGASSLSFSGLCSEDVFTLTPWDGAGVVRVVSVTGAVSQGETDLHLYSVSSDVRELRFMVEWSNPSNSLSLDVIAPDGQAVATFTDGYDGAIDAKISVMITFPTSHAGYWNVLVGGNDVSGSQSYQLSMWAF